ncbi:unnamed protein product, partial [Brassica rapa]
MCTDGQPQTSCVPRGPKSPEQSKGRVSVLSPRTNVLKCVLMDSYGCPVCADEHTRTHTDSHKHVLCVLTETHGRPVQPTWAQITRTVHGKGQRAESKDQRAESKDQRADMCTDGQPQTSYSPRGPQSPKQSTGRASMLSPRTSVLICVLMDSHGCLVHIRPVCADGHTRTSCVCWWTPMDILCILNRQPTWAKITRTVHEKGQRAESKDQRTDMCTDGQPQMSCVC